MFTEQQKGVLALIAKTFEEIKESILLNDIYSADIAIEQGKIYLDVLSGSMDDIPTTSAEIQALVHSMVMSYNPNAAVTPVFVPIAAPDETCLNCHIYPQAENSIFCLECQDCLEDCN